MSLLLILHTIWGIHVHYKYISIDPLWIRIGIIHLFCHILQIFPNKIQIFFHLILFISWYKCSMVPFNCHLTIKSLWVISLAIHSYSPTAFYFASNFQPCVWNPSDLNLHMRKVTVITCNYLYLWNACMIPK